MHRILNLGWPLRVVVTAATLCGPASALAQATATEALTFPPSLDHAALATWLKRDTDLPPETVVAISPQALVAITQTRPMATPEGFEVTVRAETLDAAFSQQEGLASWQATMKLACKDRTFSMGEVTGHTARNLKGEGRPIQTTLLGWKPVTEGTMQGEIWKARCGSDFRPPLVDAAPQPPTPKPAVIAPAPPAPPPPSAPAPSPEPKPPAALAKPARATATSVQILSAPTAAEAAQALARLKVKLGDAMAGLSTEVVAVQIDGKTRHRAIVSGFAAPGDASRFCQELQAKGGKCFARDDGGRAKTERAP